MKRRPIADMIGTKRGRLTVCRVERGIGKPRLLCKCDCGRDVSIIASHVRTGHTQSCGCLHAELLVSRGITHGESYSPEYVVWTGIKQRCFNSADETFKRYGARGIALCPRWHDFATFLSDMGRRPSVNHSIERIDNNGDYEPSNCRWATDKEQSNNRRNNRYVTYNGLTMTLAQWSERTGIKQHTIRARLERGWSEDNALTLPTGTWL